MPWTCPHCKKIFAKTKQSHKCEVVDIEELFIDKAVDLKSLYEILQRQISQRRNSRVTTSKKAITLYTENHKAFLGISVKKYWLDIWFNLDRKIDEFPIYKIVQPSRLKFGHFVRLHDRDDIDAILIDWITEAYDLANTV